MDTVECELAQIMITERPDAPQVVVLREKEGAGRMMPIMIGIYEAVAINRAVCGEEVIRPMTHDLLTSVIEQMGGELDRIVVNDLVDSGGSGTFYGLLVIERSGVEIEIDCRPSDAIALAVRTGCRIFVSDHVLQNASSQG